MIRVETIYGVECRWLKDDNPQWRISHEAYRTFDGAVSFIEKRSHHPIPREDDPTIWNAGDYEYRVVMLNIKDAF